jgi:hypothetical protein
MDDLTFIDTFRKKLLQKKESPPLKLHDIKATEELEVEFKPEPSIRLAVDNTKKGLLDG